MPIMSTNFPKTLVWKHEYNIKLWRHKESTPSTNDQHMSLYETPPWKSSAYANDQHATDMIKKPWGQPASKM